MGRHIKEEELGDVPQGLVQLEVQEDIVGDVDCVIRVELAGHELHGVIGRIRLYEHHNESHLFIVEP